MHTLHSWFGNKDDTTDGLPQSGYLQKLNEISFSNPSKFLIVAHMQSTEVDGVIVGVGVLVGVGKTFGRKLILDS